MGQHPEQVAEVGFRVEPMQARGGDQGQEVTGSLRVVVTADEQPRLAADGDAAKLALGGVVIQAQATVVVEPGQRSTLAMRVAERGAKQAALIADALVLDVDPGEEGVGMRAQVDLAERLDLAGGLAPPRAVERKDACDARQAFAGNRVLGDRRVPELAARMGPAADLMANGEIRIVVAGRRSGGRNRRS